MSFTPNLVCLYKPIKTYIRISLKQQKDFSFLFQSSHKKIEIVPLSSFYLHTVE